MATYYIRIYTQPFPYDSRVLRNDWRAIWKTSSKSFARLAVKNLKKDYEDADFLTATEIRTKLGRGGLRKADRDLTSCRIEELDLLAEYQEQWEKQRKKKQKGVLLRVDLDLHKKIHEAAFRKNKSIQAWLTEVLKRILED